MTDTRPQSHRIDYIEFTVRDMAKSKHFYTEVFGWTFRDYGSDYAGILGDGDREMGGFAIGDPSPTTPGSPLIVLSSDNLEATLTAVQSAGGEITKTIFSFPGGRRFHFRDPNGAELAVWSAAGP